MSAAAPQEGHRFRQCAALAEFLEQRQGLVEFARRQPNVDPQQLCGRRVGKTLGQVVGQGQGRSGLTPLDPPLGQHHHGVNVLRMLLGEFLQAGDRVILLRLGLEHLDFGQQQAEIGRILRAAALNSSAAARCSPRR